MAVFPGGMGKAVLTCHHSTRRENRHLDNCDILHRDGLVDQGNISPGPAAREPSSQLIFNPEYSQVVQSVGRFMTR